MPASWEEGNAARQPAPEPSANPFVPVDYTSRLQEMPRRAAHGARISYQPGQRYGHGPAGYGAGPYAQAAQTMPSQGRAMQPDAPQGMPYAQPAQSAPVVQPPMNQSAWANPAAGMVQGYAMPNAPQGMPYAQVAQSAPVMQPPMNQPPWGNPAAGMVQGYAMQPNAPQGVPYAQPAQSAPVMQPPMNQPWGNSAAGMVQGYTMQPNAPQGVPYAQAAQPAPWNGGASGGTAGIGPVPYEAYLSGAPQPAAWSGPAGTAPQAMPYAQMFQPAQSAPQYGGMQNGVPDASRGPFAPPADSMQGTQAGAQMANPWRVAVDGASPVEEKGESQNTQSAQEAAPVREAQAAPAADEAPFNAAATNGDSAAPAAPRTASPEAPASPDVPAYLKRRSARHAAAAQDASPMREAPAASAAAGEARSNASVTNAASAAASAASAAPEAPASPKRRSARHAAAAQDATPAWEPQAAPAAAGEARSNASVTNAASAAASAASAAPKAPASPKRRSARHAAAAQEAQSAHDTRIAQRAQSASASAEAAPRRRRHAASGKAAVEPSESTASPSRRAQRRADSPAAPDAHHRTGTDSPEMRDAYSPRASQASPFPEMEQGMASAFPEGAAPAWNAPEYDGAPSPEAFFAEEAAPAADPEPARDPHALRDPFTPAKSRRGKAAQASAAPARPPVRPWRVAALVVVIAMLLFCLIAGGSLIARLTQNERRMNQAREDYRNSMGVDLLSDASRVVLLPEGQTYAPTQTLTARPVQTPVPTPIIPMNEAAIGDMNRRDTSAVQEPEASPAPTSARTRLTAYPKNEMRNLMAALEPLREENGDVVGHLVIDGLIDEVVVQRNNTYYLTHNYRGSSSNAGAVFADESCTFFKPPENLLLRGQSAVESKVFAPLWQYAAGGISFAASHTHARLTTLYEDETYVLLAVIQAASDPSDPNYFNYASHPTFTTDADFLQYVQEARAHSMYPINVDVSAGDRLLTLATVGGESCLVLIFKMIA